MKSEKIAYASAFCSYLLENVEGVRSVILYGSTSRREEREDSDIDIFIDTISHNNKEKINKTVDNFTETQISKTWKMKGVSNQISVVIGNLESKEWQNLKRSIITDGIVLYGKYKATPAKLRHHILFSYTDIKEVGKRVNLHRKLFGYSINEKHYEGAVDKLGGIRYGRGSFSLPIENYNVIKAVFRKLKITPKITEIWID